MSEDADAMEPSQPLRSSLVFDVRAGERLELSGAATIELVHKSGQLCRLYVTAPRDVLVQLEKKPGAQGCQSRYKDGKLP